MTGLEVETLESAPALAEISQVSSTDSEDDVIKRTLFIDETPLMTNQLGVVENIQQLEDKPVYGSEISITSSDATVVASWNLSAEIGGSDCEGYNDESHQEILFEEPPEEHIGSCNGGLSVTPKQLAEMFLLFNGARKLWSNQNPEEQTEKPESELPLQEPRVSIMSAESATKEVWKRRAETLEQQCTTLKAIARVDSANIVKLKRSVEVQRELNAKKDVELHGQRLNMRIVGQRVETMAKEAEMHRERETELLETIRVLKEEVDHLSKSAELSKIWKSKQTQRARIQNQILASQILKSEASVAELRTSLQQKEKENADLRCEVETLTARLGTLQDAATDESTNVVVEDDVQHPPNNDIMEALRQISERLQVVERWGVNREENRHDVSIEKESESDQPALEEAWKKPEDIIRISQHHDEIEVFLASQAEIAEADYLHIASEQEPWCCGAWGIMA